MKAVALGRGQRAEVTFIFVEKLGLQRYLGEEQAAE